MNTAARRQRPLAWILQILALLVPLSGAALAAAPEPRPPEFLPLPPILVQDALAAMPRLQPAGQMPLADGLTLHLAVPAGDRCSPQAAWLLCPGLRLASRGTGGDAMVLAAWHTTLPNPPALLAGLRQAALDRHGPPAWEERVIERRWGLDLVLHRMSWTLSGRIVPLWLEAIFVLEEAPAEDPALRVRRIGWSATPEQETTH